MAYARPYGQNQGASPWSSGVPPGLQQQQQQQQAQQVQPMFNQPMGAFDISGAWQGQQQQPQQWVQPMQQVQFVPNPAYMQQPQMRPQPQHQQQQQQRPMHQRSLSAPRSGVNGLKRPMNQNNNNFGGPQQNWHKSHQNNNNQQRVTRQQSRMNNQKGQFNNSNNNNNNHSNNSNNNNNHNHSNKQQQPQQQQNQQQQKQQQQQQQPAKQAARKVKVTKVKKQVAVKAKQGNKVVSVGNKVDKPAASDAKTDKAAIAADDSGQPVKAQSKTAERKQLKLQARKNAEALQQSKLPVAKATKAIANADGDQKADEPIEQAQLKCVPAVFGFVCKLCDVFLRDKNARREHIDSGDHMEKFKAFEEDEKAKQQEQEAKVKQEQPSDSVAANTTTTTDTTTATTASAAEAQSNDAEVKKESSEVANQ